MIRKAPSEKVIFNHLEYAVLVINQENEIVMCNDAVSQLWERDKNRIVGRKITDLLSHEERLLSHLQEVLDHGKNIKITDYSIQLPNLKEKVVNLSLSPIFKKNQQVQNAVLSMRDMTHDFQIKAKEKEKAILDSIGTFVSSIAHEIQNPLSGIKGVTQLLQRQLKKAELSVDSTDMILRELGRIDRLVKELLLHSQPIPLEYNTVNLHELLNTVVWFEENSNQPGYKFVRHFDPSLPDIEGDRDKLHQVFLNLIKNAVEASPENGKIIIRSHYCPQWEIVGKKLDIQKEYFRVDFEDEGPGVAQENQDQLFKPLFTTKPKGHGLGLSISFRIIAEHGGLLQYQPGPNGGSIFQVYIPRTPSSRVNPLIT